MGIIYCATRTDDGRKYYGMTIKTLEERKKGHLRDVSYGSSYVFHNMLRKHELVWTIVEECDDAMLAIREKFYINRDSTMWPSGFNMTSGGEGAEVCDLVKEKISRSLQGRVFSKEHRQNIGFAASRRVWTEETRKKISMQSKGRKYPNRKRPPAALSEARKKISEKNKVSQIGNVKSDETKRKISEAMKKRWAERRGING